MHDDDDVVYFFFFEFVCVCVIIDRQTVLARAYHIIPFFSSSPPFYLLFSFLPFAFVLVDDMTLKLWWLTYRQSRVLEPGPKSTSASVGAKSPNRGGSGSSEGSGDGDGVGSEWTDELASHLS